MLVNCAGGNVAAATVPDDASPFDVPIEAYRDVIDLNLIGTLLPIRVFGAAMRDSAGCSIVNVSSLAAARALTRVGGYGAAKAAVESITRWLAVELARRGTGIRVNAIAPGFVIGDQNRSLLVGDDGELDRAWRHDRRAHAARTPRRARGARLDRRVARVRRGALRDRHRRAGGRRLQRVLGRLTEPDDEVSPRSFSVAGYRIGFMRRLVALAALAAVAVVATVFVATASAKTIRGTAKAELLRGTASADKIYGGAGNDRLYGLAGNDYLYPGAGIDMVYCGAGIDHVLADVKDKVAKDCEIVLRPDDRGSAPIGFRPAADGGSRVSRSSAR